MCGIAGVVGERQADEAVLRRMAAVLAHRGPDDEGIHIDGGVGLAHRRLAILDLTPTGHQPMSNEDGSVWIVYNGEVYNAREIGRELESAGHVFRGRSDTEVIVHAYERWGEDAVRRFNGMWAFAVWDARRRRLVCSRDRFGVKPLYHHRSPSGTFVFGSEIKAVLAAGLPVRVNEPYAAHVLTTALVDDGDETFFRGVGQLPPAHNLVWEHGESRLSRYWDVEPGELRERWGSAFPTAAEGVRELLADAVRIRVLASDVQVGSCLSGGLDSSSVVALGSRVSGVPMATFSCSYDSPGFDERRHARLVAQRFGCDAREVTPKAEDFFGVLERMAWHQDEPAAGPGLYSQWHVMGLAAPHVKVLLDGQGGDETMAGYRYHLEGYLRCLARDAARGDLSAARRLRHDLPLAAGAWGLGTAGALGRAFGPARLKAAYLAGRGTSSAGDVSPEVRAEARRHPVVRRPLPRMGDPLNDRLYADVVRDSMPGLLHYEDRNSMAFSIEARTPFLDYRFVEYALSIPGPDKVRDCETKWLFRRAMEGVTPQEILDRQDKLGYATPVGGWFRGPLAGRVGETLLDPATLGRGVLDPAAVRRGLADHLSGRADNSWRIYRWLSVEQWFRTFADARPASLGPERPL